MARRRAEAPTADEMIGVLYPLHLSKSDAKKLYDEREKLYKEQYKDVAENLEKFVVEDDKGTKRIPNIICDVTLVKGNEVWYDIAALLDHVGDKRDQINPMALLKCCKIDRDTFEAFVVAERILPQFQTMSKRENPREGYLRWGKAKK